MSISALTLAACAPVAPEAGADGRATVVVTQAAPGAPTDTLARVEGGALVQSGGEYVITAAGTVAGAAHYVRLVRVSGGRPAVGRYPLDPVDAADSGRAFQSVYEFSPPAVADTARLYVSVAGTLVITASSDRLVEGRFEFTGAEYSASAFVDGREFRRGSGRPEVVAPDAPRVQVAGDFVAVRPAPAIGTPGGG